MIDLVKTEDARKVIGELVPWLKKEGGELSHVTFDRLVEEKILRPAIRVPGGARFFQRRDVVALAKKFPPVRPPNRIGIVGWLQGKRPKKS